LLPLHLQQPPARPSITADIRGGMQRVGMHSKGEWSVLTSPQQHKGMSSRSLEPPHRRASRLTTAAPPARTPPRCVSQQASTCYVCICLGLCGGSTTTAVHAHALHAPADVRRDGGTGRGLLQVQWQRCSFWVGRVGGCCRCSGGRGSTAG